MRRAKSRGFTLIELVIVMAVAAILLAIAIPSYNSQARKSRRSEAITQLSDMQMRQERWRAEHSTYGTLADIQIAATPASGHYNYAVTANTATNYTMTATAKAGGAQAGDTGCTTLTFTWLNNTLTKGPAPCF